MEFPEVITATSRSGAAVDGADGASLFNANSSSLKPPDQWTTAHHRDGLVHAMQERLSQEFVGIEFSYSQAISDNVQEAASGVKGANAIKVFGPELDIIARKAEEIRQVMEGCGVCRPRGVPLPRPADGGGADRPGQGGTLRLMIDDITRSCRRRSAAARRGAVRAGGDRNFPWWCGWMRLPRQPGGDRPHSRRRPAAPPWPMSPISGWLRRVLHLPRGRLPLRADPLQRAWPRPGQHTVAEARRWSSSGWKCRRYRPDWVGEFRDLQEAIGRLLVVVPAALALILVLLYVQFDTLRETLLVFRHRADVDHGGIAALAVAGLNFSVPGGHRLPGTVRHHRDGRHHRCCPTSTTCAGGDALADRAGPGRHGPHAAGLHDLLRQLHRAAADGAGHRHRRRCQKPLALVVVGGIGLVPLFILVVFPAMIDLFGRAAPYPPGEAAANADGGAGVEAHAARRAAGPGDAGRRAGWRWRSHRESAPLPVGAAAGR